jgi:50S ribosomal subunit-associated GTPase HflX
MKYRSAKVKLRQQLSIVISIIAVLAVTSSISVQAINKADQIAQEQIAQPEDEAANQEDLAAPPDFGSQAIVLF